MDMEGIERITEFMRHSRSEQRQRRETFTLDSFFRGAACLRDVSEDHGITNHLQLEDIRSSSSGPVEMKWHHVEVEETVLRIEDLHIPGKHGLRLHEPLPIKAAQFLSKRL